MKLPTWQPFLYSESPMKYYQDDCDRRPYTCSVFVFCSCLSLHTLPPFEHRNLLVCRRSTSLLSSYNALAWSMISYTPILGCRSKDFRVTIDHAPYIFWYLDENIAWGGVASIPFANIWFIRGSWICTHIMFEMCRGTGTWLIPKVWIFEAAGLSSIFFPKIYRYEFPTVLISYTSKSITRNFDGSKS